MTTVDPMTTQISALCETVKKFLVEHRGIAEQTLSGGLDLGASIVPKDEVMSFWVNCHKGPAEKAHRDRVLRQATARGFITVDGGELTFHDQAWAQSTADADAAKAAALKDRQADAKAEFVDRMLAFDTREMEYEKEAVDRLCFAGCAVHWKGMLAKTDGFHITDGVLRRKAMVDVVHGGQLRQGVRLMMNHDTVVLAKGLEATIVKRVSMTKVLVVVEHVLEDMALPSTGYTVNVQWNGVTFTRRWSALMALKRSSAALPMAIVHGTRDVATNKAELVRTVPAALLGELPAHLRANTSQGEAIKSALEQRLTLIQGPPGTGKTHMATGLLYLYITAIKPTLELHQESPVLASAPSNCAADEIAHRLDKLGVENVVRLYAPGRLVPERMYHISLHSKLPRDEDGNAIADDQTVHAVLSTASIIVTTCSAAGDRRLEHFEFPFVLVDESTQCVESETLIPLMHGAHQAVLVGDPKQLSPVVKTAHTGEGRSMFVRLVAKGEQVHCLKTQYRMHPAIARFPNDQFYGGQLLDGVTEKDRGMGPRWFHLPNEATPVVMLDVDGEEARPAHGFSFMNEAEGETVRRTVQLLTARGVEGHRMGVICMYNAQVDLVNQMLPGDAVEVGTVDSFQGREKDVIIVTTVRANGGLATGFVESPGRLNVAITRARQLLIIVGHGPTLSSGPLWGSLLQHLKRNQCFVEGHPWLHTKTKATKRTARHAAAEDDSSVEESSPPHMEGGIRVTARDLAEAAGGSAAAAYRKQTAHDDTFDFMAEEGPQSVVEHAAETRPADGIGAVRFAGPSLTSVLASSVAHASSVPTAAPMPHGISTAPGLKGRKKNAMSVSLI